jgi:2-polyprenyl-3-methyl-5-hydroxy-6-metoxy-1,4-benzoquinol methylase
MSGVRRRERQYDASWEAMTKRGPVELGPMLSDTWRQDPRRLGFVLARYKFVAKMLAGTESVLEVGSGDGFGARVVLQTVGRLHGIDLDEEFVAWARRQAEREELAATFESLDLMETSPNGSYGAVFSLDVIEHIEPRAEEGFLRNIIAPLDPDGVCIIGTPNITASAYASPQSEQGHVNLKSERTLRDSLTPLFRHVFSFGMNDEVLHTGFGPMAHYLFALAVGKLSNLQGRPKPAG